MSAFGNARAVVTPLWTRQTGLSGHGGSPPSWLDSLLNCKVVLVVQRTRSLAISILRLDGHANIAAANRHHARDPRRTLKLIQAA